MESVAENEKCMEAGSKVNIESIPENALQIADNEDDCNICYMPCNTRSICCKCFLCKECTLKWWEYRRQCPYCRKDMIDLDLWAKKYKNDDKCLDYEGQQEHSFTYTTLTGVMSTMTDYLSENDSAEGLQNFLEIINDLNGAIDDLNNIFSSTGSVAGPASVTFHFQLAQPQQQ